MYDTLEMQQRVADTTGIPLAKVEKMSALTDVYKYLTGRFPLPEEEGQILAERAGVRLSQVTDRHPRLMPRARDWGEFLLTEGQFTPSEVGAFMFHETYYGILTGVEHLDTLVKVKIWSIQQASAYDA